MLRRDVKTDVLVNLRTYWDSLRNGRVAPYRAELDPRKFEDALENMFILEQLNPAQLRVRLAGMSLCEMMGMEVRGMPPEAFMAAADRPEFIEHLNTVLNTPAVIELDLMARGHDGQITKGQMLLLPLRSDFGEVTRVLGCVITEERVSKAPVNFSITAHRITRIQADGSIEGEAPRNMPGFAEAAAPFPLAHGSSTPLRTVEGNPKAERTERRRNHLRVVSSKDDD